MLTAKKKDEEKKKPAWVRGIGGQRRIQVRFPEDLAEMIDQLGAKWHPVVGGMFPSDVIRECVRRIHAEEFPKGKSK